MLFTSLRYHFLKSAGKFTSKAYVNPDAQYLDEMLFPAWREAQYNQQTDKWRLFERTISSPNSYLAFQIGPQ
jgi:hypothetical protein